MWPNQSAFLFDISLHRGARHLVDCFLINPEQLSKTRWMLDTEGWKGNGLKAKPVCQLSQVGRKPAKAN